MNLAFPFEIDEWSHQNRQCDERQRIQYSIYLILSTHVQERWMNQKYGSHIKDYIFENQTHETMMMIQKEIIASLHKWEPRIKNIELNFQQEEANLFITISYQNVKSLQSDHFMYTINTRM